VTLHVAHPLTSSQVPSSVEHYLIWTVLPVLPPDLPPIIRPRVHQDGLWGFTGCTADSPPPSPSLLPACLPALSEWCITEASLICSPRGTDEEEAALREIGLESVPDMAHIHVFARYKSPEELNAWDTTNGNPVIAVELKIL